MLSAINSAVSGLQAYSLKTQATANNVANLNTEGFKRDVVTLSSQTPQGVRASVSKDQSAGALVAESTDTGTEMVEQSNVDLVQEMPDLIMEKNGFSANIKTLQTTDQMMESLINLKA
ncbi:MAG: flagellar basal body rod C-terminal domain-containing protein [Desulfobulbus sp.]|nr:flagellar basal body rod C-terminal domain-containing protein [Desulfobulbus sp.]